MDQKQYIGGGEILDYMNGDYSKDSLKYMDHSMLQQFAMLPYIKILIILILILLMTFLILRIFKIKSPFKGKGITNELNHMDDVRKRDAAILRANKWISNVTSIIEHSPFRLSSLRKEYLNYNLIRANIKAPGNIRVIKAEEFNAIIKTVQIFGCAISLLLTILVNYMLGLMLFTFIVILGNTIPMMYVRNIVKLKDDEIVENFSDFYLMIHYVLIARANTPLSGIMKSYDKTTNSEEMHRFVDVCVSNLETYGEYEGPMKIAERYKEIPVVQKLMRLIRQANEGADVVAELNGFRKELIDARQYALTKRKDKLVARARRSFNLLMPILIQAIISAMAIYASDLSLTGSLF